VNESDQWIADRCGYTDRRIGQLRDEHGLHATGKTNVHRGAETYPMNFAQKTGGAPKKGKGDGSPGENPPEATPDSTPAMPQQPLDPRSPTTPPMTTAPMHAGGASPKISGIDGLDDSQRLLFTPDQCPG